MPNDASPDAAPIASSSPVSQREGLPRWVPRAILIFWLGWIATLVVRWTFSRVSALLVLLLMSLFLSLAIEPGVNKLAARGWRRGTATAMILLVVFLGVLGFLIAIGTLVGTQIADLLDNSSRYVTRTVDFLNDTFNLSGDRKIDASEWIEEINDPNGSVQQFINNQRDKAIGLSAAALGALFQTFSVLLFTFYLVADGPKLRRSICSRLPGHRQETVLKTWDLAITKTGGYLYSRLLLAGLATLFHWIVFAALDTKAPIALALWVGLISQFLPVVGTYLAGVLPVLLTFIDSPQRAVIVAAFVVFYQQLENYLFAPRITARTMELHPALAFGAALAGGATLGVVGAVLALPAAAMLQAIGSEWGQRHEVIDNHLTSMPKRRNGAKRPKPPGRAGRTRARGSNEAQ